MLTLQNQQDQAIDLLLNDEDSFHIQYAIWEGEIDITDIYAADISIFVLLSVSFIRGIETQIIANLTQSNAEDYASSIINHA